MQNVKKLSRTAAVFLLAALILICSTVLPNTGTTVSAASAELTSIGLAEHALKAYRDGWQYSYGAYGHFNSNGGIRPYRYDPAHARPNCDHCEL